MLFGGQGRVGLAGQGLGGGFKGFAGSKFRNVCRIFVQKRRKWHFLKDALWGGGGYPPELAWWTGGRPRALVAGEGYGSSKKGEGSKEHRGESKSFIFRKLEG